MEKLSKIPPPPNSQNNVFHNPWWPWEGVLKASRIVTVQGGSLGIPQRQRYNAWYYGGRKLSHRTKTFGLTGYFLLFLSIIFSLKSYFTIKRINSVYRLVDHRCRLSGMFWWGWTLYSPTYIKYAWCHSVSYCKMKPSTTQRVSTWLKIECHPGSWKFWV